jgi:hypothetical protein
LAKNIEVKVLGDVRPLQRSLNGASRNVKEFEGHVGRAGRGALSASGAFSHLGRSIAFASGAFLGAAGFTTVVKQSVEAAMSLEKELAKTRAVFGSNTKAVDAWSKTTASAFGISRAEALKSANQFGQLFKVMGVGRRASVGMSKSLTELSAKLALFAGKSQEEAAAALAGGLTGRTRALKAYGIVIDQTTIKAEAMRLGLIKTTVASRTVEEAQTRLAIATAKAADAHKKYGENTTQVASADLAVEKAHDALAKATAGVSGSISAAAKAQAIYSLVQRQSGAASETWRREQGSAEVQLKRLHAEIHDTEVTIGNALLPTVLKITTKMADWLGKTKNQKEIQHDLNVVMKDAGIAFGIVKDVVDKMTPLVQGLNRALGGTKRTFEMLFALGIAAKLRAIGVSLGYVGTQATVAKTESAGLGLGLLKLKRMGPIYITLALIGLSEWPGGIPGFLHDAKEGFKNLFTHPFGIGYHAPTPYTPAAGGTPPRGSGHGHDEVLRGTTGRTAAGATGPITPGLKAVENFAGGRVSDDYATSGHAPNSYHYKGQAADLAPDPAVWARLYAHRGAFAELFGPWGLYHYGVKFYDSKLQAQHRDHIHVAYTGGPQAISRMMKSGKGPPTAVLPPAAAALSVARSPKASTWKGATEATIIAAKASVTSMLTAANTVIGGMAGPMDAIERAAEEHLRKLRAHLHPHMTAADLARTKADIAKWGKVLNDEISEQTKRAKRAFDKAAKEMLRAFDAETAAGLKARAAPDETPTEAILRQMQEARDDQQRQQALADAIASGDAQAVADAEYEIQVAALQKQADAERKAADEKAAKDQEDYQAARDDQRQALQDQLDDWNDWLTKKKRTWNQFWAWVKANPNGGGVIPNIGETKTAPNFPPSHHGPPEFAMGGVVGGRIGAPTLAIVHGGETVLPVGAGGGVNVTVYLQGALLGSTVPEVAETIRRELIRKGRSNGGGLFS